jgi:Peptidase family M1 domain
MKSLLLVAVCIGSVLIAIAQPDRWQQKVKYKMDIDVDAAANQFTGKQRLEYTNNSPDTIRRLFYHLYWNAFQPNSMMDVRSQQLGKVMINNKPDWDPRVRDRISKLKPDEIGYQKITSLKMDGVPQPYTIEETIMQVRLTKPVLPHTTVTLDMQFNSQVPLQVRRSGRDAANGVRLSMSQWYPKICEYDLEGWHPTPYVAREFYGVWGDFDVTINIDKTYVLGGSGNLQNPQQIGYGYEDEGVKIMRPAGDKLSWHFVASRVHDFVWAADPEYKHIVKKISGGPTIHVLYNRDDKILMQQFAAMPQQSRAIYNDDVVRYISSIDNQWEDLADAAVAVYPYIRSHYGEYPWKQYSFIQGGDGGMEYPMATLITASGLGTAFHEWMHTWFQGLMGTNESMYAWMDEGFADWATSRVTNYYQQEVVRKKLAGDVASLRSLDSTQSILPLYVSKTYNSYFALAGSNIEEPLTTHADHFETNTSYSVSSYSKGCVFLNQLGYIIGDKARDKTLVEYNRLWRFKHPTDKDFIRVAENVSGIKLDWYLEYFINTLKNIDYGIDSLWEQNGATEIRLKRVGQIPMPVDLLIEYKDGTKEIAYIPMYLMFGEKPAEDKTPFTAYPSWKWTHPTYTLELKKKITSIKSLEIDPTERMADVDRSNNRLDNPL